MRARPRGLVAMLAILATGLGPQHEAGVIANARPNLGPGEVLEGAEGKVCAPVRITTAELIRRDGSVILKVAGQAPSAGMTLEVRPVVYIMQPDYWQMALVGCLPKDVAAAAVVTSFAAEVALHGAVGSKGIDLSGDPTGLPIRLRLPA